MAKNFSYLDQYFSAPTAKAGGRPTLTVLTDIPFWEPTLGSHVRIANIIRALDTVCDVSIFVFRSVGPSVQSAYARMRLQAELVSYKSWERKKTEYPSGRFSSIPELQSSVKPSWIDAAKQFLEKKKPEYVLIEYINRSYLLDAVPSGTKTILDTHDVMSQRALAFAVAGKTASVQLSAKSEAKLLSLYDAVIAISPSDATMMRNKLGLCNVLHVPHPAIIAPAAFIRPVGERLLFVGGNSEANISGLGWFIDQVWPIIRDRCELHVVGAVCDSLKVTDSRIISHGIIDDLQAVHENADVAINAVFVGGGIKIKTLDAMSYGVPCVTTREGARGLEDAIGTGLLVAQTRSDFASLILELLDNYERRLEISKAGQSYVRERHYPSIAFKDLLLFVTHA